MNILFVDITFDGTLGGSHTCLYNLVTFLDKTKHAIFVGLYQDTTYSRKLRDAGIHVIIIKRKPHRSGLSCIRKLRNWYRLIYRHRLELRNILSTYKIDLMVLNNSVAGCKDHLHVCKKLGIPVVAFERGFINYSKGDIALSENIDMSIAVSEAVRRNMCDHEFRKASRVIYDGLPLENFYSDNALSEKERMKQALKLPTDCMVIGMVGNIREWKGQEYFVKAFALLSERYHNMYALVIGGYGVDDEQYVRRLEGLTINSPARERLIFTGYREDIPDCLKVMDVFVHASIQPEPFGMVILEAMVQKVPIIATDLGGPIEILVNGQCGILVPPKSEKAIAIGVEKYLSDASFRNDMVHNAFHRVTRDFDLRNTVKQIDEIFADVCG